ncbi:TRL domain-containing protein [Xylanibacter brevis]|uniref:TRL domain-containing protein n=1 Tax=Xylanibacter brevis TaxID=83231 RepID=UPI000486ABB4|nr:TRL domain-containing protein [Xylanibacter brevis]
MKKNVLKMAVSALFATTLTSCVTINSGASISNDTIGSKVGEAKSSIILGLWSSKGEQNDIKKAAQNGGITKIHQVEYVDKSILLGLVINHTTKVYGE